MFISASPAGREINVLTAGRRRLKNAIGLPYFANHLIARVYSCSEIKINLPYFLTKAKITLSSKKNPIAYDARDPTKLPEVPAKTTNQKFKRPLCARKPANG